MPEEETLTVQKEEGSQEQQELQCLGFPGSCQYCRFNQANAQRPDSPPCDW